jgi:hypothetical protein
VTRIEKGQTKCGKHKPKTKKPKTADVEDKKEEVEEKKVEDKGFDYDQLIPTITEDDDEEPFWTFTKLRCEGKVYRCHKASGLVLEKDADVLFGYVDNGAVTQDIPSKIKKFAKKAGIKV